MYVSGCNEKQVIDEVVAHKDKISTIHLWFDCGPHFRSYENLGHHYRMALDLQIKVIVHYFAEKHGKGDVDTFFSQVMQWIKRGLAKKDALIEDLLGLLKCFSIGAAADMKIKPHPAGPVYHVEIFDSQEKPHTYTTLGAQQLQITKTYCLEFKPHVRSSTCSVHNRFFSTNIVDSGVELLGALLSTCHISFRCMVIRLFSVLAFDC